MQELKYENEQGKVKTEKYPIPENATGITISLRRDLKHKSIVLEIGTKSVSLSIQGARDLALALRQNANFIEKHQ